MVHSRAGLQLSSQGAHQAAALQMLPTWIVPTRLLVFLFLVKTPAIREMRSIEIQAEDLNSDLRVLLGR